jgi:MoaA/NifB/PqqE/SkfB family radical SAM enzyme
MRLESIHGILEQARDLGTIEWIYFEGGEPFLHYPVLVRGVEAAAEKGFRVGIVTNAYWATSVENALEWLRPFAGSVQDLSVSSDLFHGSEKLSQQAKDASVAAERLGIPLAMIAIARPEREDAPGATGRLPAGESAVMFRGRAADVLVRQTTHRSWETFVECPHEDLREPGRVHVDPFGRVHACQGISLGCMFHTPLRSICEEHDPDSHHPRRAARGWAQRVGQKIRSPSRRRIRRFMSSVLRSPRAAARPVSRCPGAGSDVRSVRELKRPFLQAGFRARQ